MKKPIWAVLLALCVVGGCATQARLEKRVNEKVAAWKAAHGGQEPDAMNRAKLEDESAQEVASEVAKEREEAAAKLGQTVGAFATGNIIGGILGLVGLAGLGVSAVQKARGA